MKEKVKKRLKSMFEGIKEFIVYLNEEYESKNPYEKEHYTKKPGVFYGDKEGE